MGKKAIVSNATFINHRLKLNVMIFLPIHSCRHFARIRYWHCRNLRVETFSYYTCNNLSCSSRLPWVFCPIRILYSPQLSRTSPSRHRWWILNKLSFIILSKYITNSLKYQFCCVVAVKERLAPPVVDWIMDNILCKYDKRKKKLKTKMI